MADKDMADDDSPIQGLIVVIHGALIVIGAAFVFGLILKSLA